MWYLDFVALFSCMRFCTDSDYRGEFEYLTRNASETEPHKIVWAHPKGRDIHIIVRVSLESGIDWVEIDFLINTAFLIRSSLLDRAACPQPQKQVSYA